MSTNEAKIQISDGVNPVTYNSDRLHAGVGYIVLSRDYDRQVYINNCYRNNTVVIKTDRGEFIKNCSVDKSCWNNIQFPLSYRDSGSLVVWINIPISNKCVIVAVLNKANESNNANQNASYFGQRNEVNGASIIADSNSGALQMVVNSQSDNEAGIYTKILNLNTTGQHDTYVQGDITMQAERTVSFRSAKHIDLYVGDPKSDDLYSQLTIEKDNGLTFKDEFGNLILTNEEGFKFYDNFNNQILTTETGLEITDVSGNKINTSKDEINIIDINKNIIKLNKDGISQISKTINLVTDTLQNDKDSAILYKPTQQLLNSTLNILNSLAQIVGSLTVIVPAGTVNPAVTVLTTDLQTQIQTLIGDIKKIESQTVKLT